MNDHNSMSDLPAFRRRGGLRGRSLIPVGGERDVSVNRVPRDILLLPPEDTQRNVSWRPGIFGALDIGTTKMTCLIGKGEPDGSIQVLGHGWRRSHGIRSGSIVDIREAEAAIRATVGQAEEAAERRMDSLVVNLSCGRPLSRLVDAQIPIGGREVTAGDVQRLIAEGQARAWMEGREVIHTLPIGYVVDSIPGIADPIGHQCEELATRMHVVDMNSSALRTLDAVLQHAELKLDGLVASPFASGVSVLAAEERELGVTVVEMGGGTTSLAVFCEGKLLHTAQIRVGGLHVTRDIAGVLSTSLETAERLKTMYGAAQMGSDDQREILSVPLIGENSDRLVRLQRSKVISVIQPRIEETLELVRQSLDNAGLGRLANGRVVLTGGASLLEGIVPVATRILGRPVRMGKPQNIYGLPETAAASAGFSTAAGLLAWAAGADRDFGDISVPEPKPRGLVKRLVGFIRNNV
ncbi:cell division protein FtsA [Gluconobacter sphaericus]|uniref:Cell division protein FtsA n=1 Tax=Gluconobacter sphaericus NBRC 12467 TaxID=1307951 RepID=A0AA37SKY9_9PROT|nr:cell division protein FtsA [Gluconobacter sphaericus]MBF0886309.1 cell division protein FtsA [Gluconobacter sphaericus]MBS1086347.1 cell division protein FtsA [Gluconobacter sphaericus]MBS1100345.1 cell division protein FtsA [Gluconobacter sphaericus]QQX91257.1 cell division protein FtsA [Gluconobacter sphaericus]GBR52497.1 cell division protein FtsA [Gluconobacter sphaericus NBRC 12467]